jgi:hypothetical protein
MPKCKKETYDNKKWFCGEHQLQFKEYLEKVGVTALGLGTLAITFIMKGSKNK